MKETIIRNEAMLSEVIKGMSLPQKSLPSKYFYDEKGSQLFEEITELEEYYPTRIEWGILEKYVLEMEQELGELVLLIEPGSGSSEKTRVLLDNMESICCYIPMDISGDYLLKIAEKLRSEYPNIDIQPLSVDYTRSFELPSIHVKAQRVVFFPGSTIGNFKPKTVENFFSIMAEIVGKDGAILIGVDLKKEKEVLEAAYNDSKGVTADFNKNMLTHINREIGSNFDIQKFEHKSIWKENLGRIEMRLIAKEDHYVSLDGHTFKIKEGEYIHTENSHKYSLQEFEELVKPWFSVGKVWTDEKNYFSVQYLKPI